MEPTTIDKLLTTEDLAEILQMPVRTLEDWRVNQYGPSHIRVGKRVRYRPADVKTWIENQGAA